jgi:hypothetical protein
LPGTIRFSELVKKSGQPQSITLWSDPKRDPSFQKAIKQNRVLTVKQETVGNKKDVGAIGFRREQNVSYLIFPKSLPKTDSRIVGIKYGLLENPKPKDPVSKGSSVRKNIGKVRTPEKEFSAILRRTAYWETSLRVKANNKLDAKMKMEKEMATKNFPEADAVIRNELRDLAVV